MFKRTISLVLCLLMVFSTLSFTAFAADEEVFIYSEFSDKVRKTEQNVELATDANGYFPIPLDLAVYANDEVTGAIEVIFYVINHAGERIGQESDESIIGSYLDEGYVVVTVDYKNNPLAVTPYLEHSLVDVRTYFKSGNGFADTDYSMYQYCGYFLPAGYRIAKDITFWESDKHGSKGTLNAVINAWNIDIYGAGKKMSDGTAAKEATTIEDCTKKDGSPMDYTLEMDIIYPSQPKYATPVYAMAATQDRKHWHTADHTSCNYLGFSFNGYTAVVWDHEYIPMARSDHWGYIDHYGTQTYNGNKVASAAVRCIRYFEDTYGYNADLIGVGGISKGSYPPAFLSRDNNHLIPERKFYAESENGTLFEGDTLDEDGNVIETIRQPYLTYEGGYESTITEEEGGTPISTQITVAYSAAGDGADSLYQVHKNYTGTPMVLSCGINDPYGCWSRYAPLVEHFQANSKVPFIEMGMLDQGHVYPTGYDVDKEYERYPQIMKFFDRYLKPDVDFPAEVMWATPRNNADGVSINENVEIRFLDMMDVDSVKNNVKIVEDETNTPVTGTWTSTELDMMFTFSHAGFKAGTVYRIEISTAVETKDGNNLEKVVIKRFKTEGNYTLTALADTYVSEANPDTVYGNESTIVINGLKGNEKTAFVTFDATNLSTVVGANLSIPVLSEDSQFAEVYVLDNYMVNEDTLTYNNMPTVTDENYLTSGIVEDASASIDISGIADMVSGDYVTLVIKGKKVEESTLDYDFEDMSGTLTSGSIYDTYTDEDGNTCIENKPVSDNYVIATGGSPSEIYVTDTQNLTEGGTRSLRMKTKNGYDRIKFYNSFGTTKLTNDDIGRTFLIDFSIKTGGHTGQIYYGMMSLNSGEGGSNSAKGITYTGAVSTYSSAYCGGEKALDVSSEWIPVNDYKVTITEEMVNTQAGMLTIENKTANTTSGEYNYIYIDDLLIKEYAPQNSVASREDAANKQITITTYNADTTVNVTDTAITVKGSNPDAAGDTENLTVSYVDDTTTIDRNKAYIRFILPNEISGDEFKFKFTNSASAMQKIRVYGMDAGDANVNFNQYGGSDHARWTEAGLNWRNAPGNDFDGAYVEPTYAYGGAPLATIVAKAGETYEVDATSYINELYTYTLSEGSRYATFILCADEENIITTKTYDDGKKPVHTSSILQTWSDSADYRTGGSGVGANSLQFDENVNHTPDGSGSIKFVDRTQTYSRVKLLNMFTKDGWWTADDIGRTFKVTFYVMAEDGASGDVLFGLVPPSGSTIKNSAQKTIVPNEWVKCEFTFTLDQALVGTEGSYGTTQYGCLDLETKGKAFDFWFDDITVEEVFGGATITDAKLAATVKADGETVLEDTTSEVSEDAAAFVSSLTPNKANGANAEVKVSSNVSTATAVNANKTYFSFSNVNTTDVEKAVLSFKTSGINTLNLYRLPYNAITSALTYNSAPNNIIYKPGIDAVLIGRYDVSGNDVIKTEVPVEENALYALATDKTVAKTIVNMGMEDSENVTFAGGVDYRGAGGMGNNNVSISSEQAATGTKSLKFTGMTSTTARIKFTGMLNSVPFTSADVGRKFNVSMNVYPFNPTSDDLTETNVKLGLYSDWYGSSTSSVISSAGFYNGKVPFDKWTTISTAITITQDSVDKTGMTLTLERGANTGAQGFYIDDIVITELTGDAAEEVTVSDIKYLAQKPIPETYSEDVSITSVIAKEENGRPSVKVITDVAAYSKKVSSVTYYANGTKVDAVTQATGSTYNSDLKNLPIGTYTLTSEVAFEDGTSLTSDGVELTVKGWPVHIYNSALTGSVANGSVNIACDIKNITDAALTANVVLGVYDANDNLIKVISNLTADGIANGVATIAKGGMIKIDEAVEVPNSASYVKLFVWSTGNVPYTTPLEVTVK